MSANSHAKLIALALEAPDERFWKASAFRPSLNRYESDGSRQGYRYAGVARVMGYFVLIRPYPDDLDLRSQRLFGARAFLSAPAEALS